MGAGPAGQHLPSGLGHRRRGILRRLPGKPRRQRPPLVAPGLAFGNKHAMAIQLAKHLHAARPARQRLVLLDQHLVQQGRVADHHLMQRPHPQMHHIAILGAPTRQHRQRITR